MTTTNFQPPKNAEQLLKDRYFQDGEDWSGLCRRVAHWAAQVSEEPKNDEEFFYSLMVQGKMLPNTPMLVNAGVNEKGCAAACFHLRPQDNIESILDVRAKAIMILKFGGGVGFDLSAIRPEGFPISSTHKFSCGPIRVMVDYNCAGNLITQAGIRKAALLASLRIDHPDIVKFIKAKRNLKELQNFNISVSFTDSFMKKLQGSSKKPHVVYWSGDQYNILPNGEPILRRDRGPKGVLSVGDVWKLYCESNSLNGDPGALFLDTVNKNNPLISSLNDTNNPFYLHGCNPCGELSLEHLGICLLASVDLAKFVQDGSFLYDELSAALRITTRFLDNVIDITPYPNEEIKEHAKQTRRIGVGPMGFATMLDRMKITFGSVECIRLSKELAGILKDSCDQESERLAQIRGAYLLSLDKKYRNVTRTCAAPTGSLAILADTSWSLEPHKYLAFKERRNDQETARVLPLVKEFLTENLILQLEEEAQGNIGKLHQLIKKNLPEYIKCADDISPETRIEVLSAWQEKIDSGISVTLSYPPEVLTSEKVSEIFQLAWEKKLKGITVYPDGSRPGEPMSIKSQRKRKEIPDELQGKRVTIKVSLRNNEVIKTICVISEDPDHPGEPIVIDIWPPKGAKDPASIQLISLVARLLSSHLRYRYCPSCGEEVLSIGEIIRQLDEVDGQHMFSLPTTIAKVLRPYLKENEEIGECPNTECGGTLVIIEGCVSCLSCGYRSCN